MKRIVKKMTRLIPVFTVSLLGMSILPQTAEAISIGWTGPTTNFQRFTLDVTPFMADSLDSTQAEITGRI